MIRFSYLCGAAAIALAALPVQAQDHHDHGAMTTRCNIWHPLGGTVSTIDKPAALDTAYGRSP